MGNFQEEKQLVRDFHRALDRSDVDDLGAIVAACSRRDILWRGFHPFGELRGADAIASKFWGPLRQALSRLQRREDIFFAGRNQMDDFQSVWVVSMGHLMGLFDAPWQGIRPTRKMVMLRYCTFHRVEGGKIAETAMYFDIPHLMRQAGQGPFGPQTAQFMVQPGPMTHDGLLFDPQPETEGKATLGAINAMIADLGQWDLGLPLEEELARTWHDDMIWWGPEGIGASYTIERYAKQHSGPFRAAFSNRSRVGHVARLAEGHYGGFFGWPNFKATLAGTLMGHPPTGKEGEFRVIDIYRRAGDKLAENWIFIDMLHFWKTQGLDVLKDGWPCE